MQIITITNQKGGVGKTTTALAIGQGLIKQGFKVLFIDIDAQCNLTYSLAAENAQKTSYHLLADKGNADVKSFISTVNNIDIVASSQDLVNIDSVLSNVGKEYKLKEAIQTLTYEYDYVIVDTPPTLSNLTINALVASNAVVIPVQADLFSLQAVVQLADTIKTVKQYCNSKLNVLGLLLTRYNDRTILSRDFRQSLALAAKKLNTTVFTKPIRECIAIKEAQARQESLFSYAAKSNASADYEYLIKEINERLEL